MTSPVHAWLSRRNPRLMLVVLMVLWLVQMVFWALWEWRREPVSSAKGLQEDPSPISTTTFVAPSPPEGQPEPPDCPFSTLNPDMLGRYFEYGDWRGDELEYPYNEPSLSAPLPDPLPYDAQPPASPATTAVDLEATLRYRGLMQTPQGVRIAFVEDLESARTLRLRVGDRMAVWTLQAIERTHVDFVSAQGVTFQISRRAMDPPSIPETLAAPMPVVDPGETAPQQDAVPDIAPDGLQDRDETPVSAPEPDVVEEPPFLASDAPVESGEP